MAFIMTVFKWAILIVLAYSLIKTVHFLINEPNVRRDLVHTAKEVKNIYYRYQVLSGCGAAGRKAERRAVLILEFGVGTEGFPLEVRG